MILQDYIIAFCQFGFGIALLPALWHAEKPPLATSFPMCALLLIMGGALQSLDLVLGALCCVFVAVEWFILMLQVMDWKPGDWR